MCKYQTIMHKKNLIFIIFILGMFLAVVGKAQAANVYIGPTATGNGSGADWNNMKVFPFATGNWNGFWVRGNTYYIADGNYTSIEGGQYPVTIRCSAANDGIKTITIKKAVPSGTNGCIGDACHGTDDGWLDSYGDERAIFEVAVPNISGATAMVFLFTSDYWIIDGSVGIKNNADSYGFRTRGTGTYDRMYYAMSIPNTETASHITFKYIDFQGRIDVNGIENGAVPSATSHWPDIGWDPGIYWVNSDSGEYSTDLKIEHNYFHNNDSNHIFFMGVKNIIISDNYFSINESNSGTNEPGNVTPFGGDHGVSIQNNTRGTEVTTENVIVKNNIFEDIEGTDVISLSRVNKWYIYGNIFHQTPNYPNYGQASNSAYAPYYGTLIADGCCPSSNIYIFNNSFYGVHAIGVDPSIAGAGVRVDAGTTNMNTFNNLWANCSMAWHTTGLSYNAFYETYSYSSTPPYPAFFFTDGSSFQKITANPFLSTDYLNANFLRLNKATEAGVNPAGVAAELANLPGYNLDPAGTPRANWDRGAYEYTDGQTCLTKGDFDCNTKFEALDISSMINLILKSNLTSEEIAKGDMSLDDKVDAQDLNALINEVLKSQ